MSFLLLQTLTLHISDQQLLQKLCCAKPQSHPFASGYMTDTHPLVYSAQICCPVVSQGQSEAWWFVSQVQHQEFLASQVPTEHFGQSEKFQELLCIDIQQQLLKEVCELSLLRALNSTVLIYLSYWLACLGIPLLKSEAVYPICVKGCRKNQGCQISEDIQYVEFCA